MARAVRRRGHEVAIYTTDRGLEPDAVPPAGEPVQRDGVEIRTYPQQSPRILATSWGLARALEERVPSVDLVHIHSLYLFHVWAAARACRRHGVPYIIRPHGTLDPYIWKRHRLRKYLIERLFQNRVLREAAAIHYTAEDERTLAEPYAGGAPGVIVPNGLELTDYARLPPAGSFRRLHPEIGGRRIVLFLGRLNFKKGLDLLVPAFAAARQKHGDLHLVIAGPDDGLRAEIERNVAELELGDRVTFTGMLTGEAKLAAFGDSYMFVLPSYSENFGIAVIEAMVCGLPVAITDKVNIARDVQEAGAGLVGPPTQASVIEQIDRLAADPALVYAMGAKGRTLVAARFNWERIARELETLYRSILDAKSGLEAKTG